MGLRLGLGFGLFGLFGVEVRVRVGVGVGAVACPALGGGEVRRAH